MSVQESLGSDDNVPFLFAEHSIWYSPIKFLPITRLSGGMAFSCKLGNCLWKSVYQELVLLNVMIHQILKGREISLQPYWEDAAHSVGEEQGRNIPCHLERSPTVKPGLLATVPDSDCVSSQSAFHNKVHGIGAQLWKHRQPRQLADKLFMPSRWLHGCMNNVLALISPTANSKQTSCWKMEAAEPTYR